MSVFAETRDGDVHLMYSGEHTVCGVAYDVGSEDGEDDLALSYSKRAVTCAICTTIIKACQGVSTGDE